MAILPLPCCTVSILDAMAVLPYRAWTPRPLSTFPRCHNRAGPRSCSQPFTLGPLASAPMTPMRIAVLASGGGTNLQAILEHFARLGERRNGDVVVVASDRPQAGALARARTRGIVAQTIGGAGELARILDMHGIELVVLAGYLRHVPDDV